MSNGLSRGSLAPAQGFLVYPKYSYCVLASMDEASPLEDEKHAIRVNQKALGTRKGCQANSQAPDIRLPCTSGFYQTYFYNIQQVVVYMKSN
jgi:hypothetical protein